jgi:predicted PurR-regulated permease PerM
MNGKKTVGITLAIIGLLFLAAGVDNVLANGLTIALSNGLPYFGVGLLLLLVGRYLTA